MKKLLLLLLFCLVLSGCSSGSGSPPASSKSSEAVSEDTAISSETEEYQEVQVCNYTAELPKSWIVADNIFFGKQENQIPYIMFNTIDTDKSLDAFFSNGYTEEMFIKQFSDFLENASFGTEMDHDTYGDLETRSFLVTGMRDNKPTSMICTLFDNPGGGIGTALFLFRLEDQKEGGCLHDYLKMFYTMKPLDSSNITAVAPPIPESSEELSSDQEITTDTPTELQDASAESNPMAETPETEPDPVEEEPIEQEPVAEEPVEEEPVEQEPVAEEPVADQYSPTPGEQNALASAKRYINYSPFSYSGLIDQLEYEGFTDSEAAYGADNCGADWYEQALKSAEKYLNYSAFSYSGLIEQLEYEGYTEEEASYGVDNCGADWNEQAAKKAQQYLDYSSFSRSGLIDQLEYEGFTPDQAEYGVSQVYN